MTAFIRSQDGYCQLMKLVFESSSTQHTLDVRDLLTKEGKTRGQSRSETLFGQPTQQLQQLSKRALL